MVLSKQGGALYGGFFLFLCLARMSGGGQMYFCVKAEYLATHFLQFMLRQSLKSVFVDWRSASLMVWTKKKRNDASEKFALPHWN